MKQTTSWYVRTYQSGDENQILDLFRRVFGRERSHAHWRWKFLKNPAGQQISLAVVENGSTLGQFAGLPVLVSSQQRTVLMTQGVDHMVDPTRRREGIYRAMAHHFFKTFLTPEGAAAWYAFPVRAGFEIERRTFGCVALHEVPILAWNLSKTESWRPSSQYTSRYSIDHVDRIGRPVDELWNRCRNDFPLATIRDSRYLNWRYTDCPDTKYTVLLATDRMTEHAAGLAVVRFGWLDQQVALIVDWLVPTTDIEVSRTLLAHCHDLARDRGLNAVQVSFPSYTQQHNFLISLGYEAQPSRFVTSAKAPRGSKELQLMRKGWYFTMGDSDMY